MSFKAFIEDINEKLGISMPSDWESMDEVALARSFLQGVNRYFFQTYEGIGTSSFNGEELQYFSEFHKFWVVNHQRILNPQINKRQANLVVQALDSALNSFGEMVLDVKHELHGLPLQAIAQVRFFTANQDFREPLENQFGLYLEDPTRFYAEEIINNPDGFLQFLGMSRLSQTDKRLDFAKNAAAFLIAKDIIAFEIAEYFNNDAIQVREALVKTPNMGYGLKKANMFIRDMVEFGVWPSLTNLDQIDVASDINTMKLALRNRILQTDIPLLSSFLDIFCYQYSYIDKMSAKAWRVVWEQWNTLNPKGAPVSPCKMDFLLYRIGREYCSDVVTRYICNNGHIFYHFGNRLKNCRICAGNKTKSAAQATARFLPCQVDSTDLPREKGQLLLCDDKLLKLFDGVCVLELACQPKNKDFQPLNPPKSISIKGQTS